MSDKTYFTSILILGIVFAILEVIICVEIC